MGALYIFRQMSDVLVEVLFRAVGMTRRKEVARMDKDRVSCGKCKHCSIVVVPDGADMFCPYRGIVGYHVKECKDYEPEEGGGE